MIAERDARDVIKHRWQELAKQADSIVTESSSSPVTIRRPRGTGQRLRPGPASPVSRSA